MILYDSIRYILRLLDYYLSSYGTMRTTLYKLSHDLLCIYLSSLGASRLESFNKYLQLLLREECPLSQLYRPKRTFCNEAVEVPPGYVQQLSCLGDGVQPVHLYSIESMSAVVNYCTKKFLDMIIYSNVQ